VLGGWRHRGLPPRARGVDAACLAFYIGNLPCPNSFIDNATTQGPPTVGNSKLCRKCKPDDTPTSTHVSNCDTLSHTNGRTYLDLYSNLAGSAARTRDPLMQGERLLPSFADRSNGVVHDDRRQGARRRRYVPCLDVALLFSTCKEGQTTPYAPFPKHPAAHVHCAMRSRGFACLTCMACGAVCNRTAPVSSAANLAGRKLLRARCPSWQTH
jgi:hypothetical protein